MNKRFAVTTASFICSIAFSFWIGWKSHGFRYGYHYTERDSESFQFGKDEIIVRHVTEAIGTPFMDSGTSIIEYMSDDGLNVQLYKGHRIFQESYPFVDDIRVDGERVIWEDGFKKYELLIQVLDHNNQKNVNL